MTADRAPPVVALLSLLVAVALLGAASGLVGAVNGQSPGDAVSVQTSYNGTTAEQVIRVVVQIEAPDTTLSDVHIRTDNTRQTLVEPSSYTTEVAPGNQNVSVIPQAGGNFEIAKLQPGERVTIAFAVVPETLGEAQLDAATIHVDYVKRGQRLSVDRVTTVDLSSNPWFRLQTAQERNSELAGQVGQQRVMFFAGLAVGLFGFVAAAGLELRRRKQIASFEDRLRTELSRAYNELSATDRPVAEGIAAKFGVEINDGEPGLEIGTDHSRGPSQVPDTGSGGETLTPNPASENKFGDEDDGSSTDADAADDHGDQEFDASYL